MRLEHREIRKYLDAIAAKLTEKNFETDEEEMGLETVLCPHNHKEESILYPMMDQTFSELDRIWNVFRDEQKKMNDMRARAIAAKPKCVKLER